MNATAMDDWFARTERHGPVVATEEFAAGNWTYTLLVTHDKLAKPMEERDNTGRGSGSYRCRVRATDRAYTPGQREFDCYAATSEMALQLTRRVLRERAADLEAPFGGAPRPVGYLSTTEAAELLGVTPEHVSLLCRRGTLDGVREGRDWRIPHAAVMAYHYALKDQGGRPPTSTKPVGGMSPTNLIGLIRQRGIVCMAEAVMSGGKMFVAGINEGWDLTTWRAQQTGGAILFARYDEDGAPVEPIVLAVNGPESDLTRWQALAREWGHPETIVVMVERPRD